MDRTLPTVARDWALFLDVDGTIVDYAPRPDAAIVPPSLVRTLRALSGALDGALAIVSGRSIADLDGLFAPLVLPAAGQHGAEARLGDRKCAVGSDSPALESILRSAYAFDGQSSLLIENKGLSATIHYGEASSTPEALGEILRAAVARSGGAYRLLASRRAFNIIPSGVDKGRAVDWFMTVAPFAGRVPVFIGDDRTDEDGFAAVTARGGHAIKVGPSGGSVAPWRVRDPRAIREWLDGSLALLEPSR
jgi:trehalose 6-phosphate phosphatase